ncbi:MAG: hypothetical protein AB7U62_07625 [Pseudolabrys sp.]
MASESLQDLLVNAPNKKELKELYHEINTGTDRSTVIVTSIFVENSLRDAIVARMHKLTKAEYDQLFTGNGSLSTFSNKIRLGYALGVFGSQVRNNLDLIRRIRNAFAHARRPISFRRQQIMSMANNLSHAAIWKSGGLKNAPPSEQAKGVYSLTCMFLYVSFQVGAKRDRRRKMRKPGVRALEND